MTLPLNRIVQGDSLEVLRTWPDACVQLVLTSPPYWGLRDYKAHGESLPGQWGLEPTPEAHVARLVAWAREVRRVLRPDGVLVLVYGESYTSGMRRAYANDRKYRKPRAHDHRPPTPSGLKPKDLLGIPWRLAQALQADGWWWRAWWPWVKLNGMPDSCRDRPALSCEVMLMFTRSARYYWDQEAVRVGYAPASIGEKWKARHEGWDAMEKAEQTAFGRIRKTGDWWRESLPGTIAQVRDWLAHAEAVQRGEAPMLLDFEGLPLGQLHPTFAYPGSHFATYPPVLVRPVILAATSERGQCPACGAPWVRKIKRGLVPTKKAAKTFVVDERDVHADDNSQSANRQKDGHKSGYIGANKTLGWHPSCACAAGEPVPQIVLDPFAGTGTTLVVAAELGRRTLGIDLYGGDYDFGGHTAHDRLRAAMGIGPNIDHVAAVAAGQIDFLERQP